MNRLVVRVFSALIALAIFFTIYFLTDIKGLSILILAIAFVGQLEYLNLVFKNQQRHSLTFAFVSTSTIFASFSILPQMAYVGFALIPILLFLISELALSNQTTSIQSFATNTPHFFLGILYTGILPGMVMSLLNTQLGFYWLLFLMMAVFMGDTLAYFSGLALGRKKMFPYISPNKTWAGATGGLLGSLIAGTICHSLWFSTFFPLSVFLITSVIVGISAQCGDFFESMLKRNAGVKDSGKIMPGHGGVLDRVDGILFGVPAVFWLTMWVS